MTKKQTMFPGLGIIQRHTELMIRKRWNEMEKYLENIIDGPSTINGIIKYYGVGYSEDYSEMYLLFQNKIVRTYGISEEDFYRDLRMELWVESGLTLHEPGIIAPHIPK